MRPEPVILRSIVRVRMFLRWGSSVARHFCCLAWYWRSSAKNAMPVVATTMSFFETATCSRMARRPRTSASAECASARGLAKQDWYREDKLYVLWVNNLALVMCKVSQPSAAAAFGIHQDVPGLSPVAVGADVVSFTKVALSLKDLVASALS